MSQQKRELTPARRVARAVVWTSFAFVLFIRFVVMKPEPRPPLPPGWPWAQEEPRFRRPPTIVEPPVAEVPRDLPRLQISIASKDVETLRNYYWNGRQRQRDQERPEVLATVQEGSIVYTNVALHQKGAAGSFRPFDDKPALTLNFAKHAPGQRFRGYSKISLNNSVQDPSYLCEAISRELFDAAGVPVPKAEFATVLINGRDLGLYVLVEGYNKDFLRRYFKNVKGNLYDGGFCQEVHRNLDVNSGEHPEDRSDIDQLLAAVQHPDPATRWQKLMPILDVDRFITMLAMEVLTCHWDGYGMNRNNYRLYHDLDTGRMVFMPHGMDQMFDIPPHRFPVNSSIQPATRGMVARAVLATPEGGRRYVERLQALHHDLFRNEPIVRRVRELAVRIRPTLAAYSPTVAQWHDAAVASLCDRITRRVESVTKQLENPRQPLAFDESGIVRLTQWNEAVRGPGSAFTMDTVEEAGQKLLHLTASNRGGSGSWRTRVLLEGGRYRFEGRARVSEAAAGCRLALRVSGDRLSGQPVTGTDWVPLSHTFFVEGFLSEVLLVCEFSGARGEAWFDVDSLRLVRE